MQTSCNYLLQGPSYTALKSPLTVRQIFKNWAIERVNFKNFNKKHIRNVSGVRTQDASFELLAASIGSTGWSVAVRKEKKRRLTGNFAHAQPRSL